MGGSPVELNVGGKTYRVVATAEEPVLQRLAALVDEKLRDLSGPGRPIAPQAMLLAAMTLAHELEEERTRRRHAERRTRDVLKRVLERIDAALDEADATLKPATTEDSEPTCPDNPSPPPLDG
jgi:cell division protein ZapA